MSGGSSRSSSYSKSTPWGPQAGYLQDIYSRAQNLAGAERSFYPEATYTPYSTETQAALKGVTQRAISGDPLVGQAKGYVGDVLSGRYLDPRSNPWLQATADAAAGGLTRSYKMATAPATTSRFAASGRLGSGGEYAAMTRDQDVLAKNLGDLYRGFYSENFARERGVQDQAVGQAMPLAEYAYSDLAKLGNVGAAREDMSRQILDDLMQRYYFKQDEPWQRAQDYASLIGGPVMETTQRSSSSAGQGGLT